MPTKKGSQSPQPKRICPPGKVYNPITNRCVKSPETKKQDKGNSDSKKKG